MEYTNRTILLNNFTKVIYIKFTLVKKGIGTWEISPKTTPLLPPYYKANVNHIFLEIIKNKIYFLYHIFEGGAFRLF